MTNQDMHPSSKTTKPSKGDSGMLKDQPEKPASNGGASGGRMRERDRTDRFDRIDGVRSLEGSTVALLPEVYMGRKMVTHFIMSPGTEDHDKHEIFVFDGPDEHTFDVVVIQDSKAHMNRKLIHWSQSLPASTTFVELGKLLSEKR